MEKTLRHVLLGQHYYDFLTEKVDPKQIKDLPKLFNFMYMLKLMILCIPILTLQSSPRMQTSLMILIEITFITCFIYYAGKKHLLKSKTFFWLTLGEEFCVTIYLIFSCITAFKAKNTK
jgi:hypothetical protein